MKVYELITKLQEMDPDAEVHFSYNYGDHWRTHVAPKVQRVEEGAVVWSDYHSMPKIDDSDNAEMTKVILS
jgi:hypothetical protein